MNRYFVITQGEVKFWGGNEDEPPEYAKEWLVVEAETRGKAHWQFCIERDIEWLEPVHITKLPSCDECNNTGYGNDDEPCLYCLGECVYPGGFETVSKE